MLPNRLGSNAQSASPKTRNALSGSKLVMRSSPPVIAGFRNARRSDERRRSGRRPNWLRRKRRSCRSQAERKDREEAEAKRLAEQAKREAGEAAEREAILAARRAGRKKKKRKGH
jgi:translation initiation factor IF-2